MAADGLDWGPNVDFNLDESDYRQDLITKFRRILGDDTKTQFIQRNHKKYASATFLTSKNGDLVCHLKEEDVYITAMGKKGKTIFRFDEDAFDDFGTEARKVGFKGNYNSLTRGLGPDIYKISYEQFRQAVEFLAAEMSAEDLDKVNTQKWKKSMFTVCMGLAEGLRNKIISTAYYESQTEGIPSKLPGPWVQLVIRSWSSFTKSALKCDNQNITLQDLTLDEKKMLYALHVQEDSYTAHLNTVLANHRVCRVMLAILCKKHTENMEE